MKLGEKTKSSRHLGRYRKIISVLIKYGFSDLVDHSPLRKIIPTSEKFVPYREGKSVFTLNRYERIRLVFEELGTSFIKFGQILSNRPDIFPRDLISEFEKFQDKVPPVSEKEIKEVLRTELNGKLEEQFEYINYTALASASMAQVHRGRLKDGSEIILKIQRPGIAKNIDDDIDIMKNLAHLIDKNFPDLAVFQPMDLVLMFEKAIRKELKFMTEASNIERFSHNFQGNDDIYVPKVYRSLCTNRVITMEYIDGIKINDLDELLAIGVEPQKLAIKGINLYFQQVFEHGFFHADPHPGNFFILRDGRVCMIDFGMMGNIIEADKVLLGDLMMALANKDIHRTMDILKRFSTDPSKIENITELEYDIIDFFEEYTRTSIDEIQGEDVIDGLNILFYDYRIRIPSNLLLLLKALVMVEGVGLKLDPNYNIIKNMEPFVERLLIKKYSPKRIWQATSKMLKGFSYFGVGLPADVKSVLRKMKRGTLHIEFEHKGLEPFYQNFDIYTNRIAFAIVLASLIIGSSLVVLSGIPPLVNGVPVIGVAGYLISALLALRLLISIVRHGKI